VDIVAYASGRAHLEAIVRAVGPDVVLVDEMHRPGQALLRITEVRAAEPLAAIVGLTDRPDSPWVAEALHAGATAVVPRDLAPETLGLVLREALGTSHPGDVPTHRKEPGMTFAVSGPGMPEVA
jgi:DNA-binding NarL/FixJ family response regulator